MISYTAIRTVWTYVRIGKEVIYLDDIDEYLDKIREFKGCRGCIHYAEEIRPTLMGSYTNGYCSVTGSTYWPISCDIYEYKNKE